MIDRVFWEEVQKAWITDAQSRIKDMDIGSGGDIDPVLLGDPFEMDDIPLDEVDDWSVFDAIREGRNISAKPKVPKLDADRFEKLLEKKTIPDYVEACRLLKACKLPSKMDGLYETLIERMPVLSDALKYSEGVYQADLTEFYEYYIPETLKLTANYIEYLGIGIEPKILEETEKEILDAGNQLVIAVNDKVNEIYRYASMEITAKAKALESMMNMNGYVDPDLKIK